MLKYCLFLILLTLVSHNGFTQPQPVYSKDIEQKIRQVETSLSGWMQMQDSSLWTLQDRMAFYYTPGLSIAVIKDYKIEWVRAYGMADSADGRRVTTTTRFQAASISKSLNAMGVLRLAAEKQLDLRRDINDYLRTWKLPSDSFTQKQKVTIAHLLSHTAGLSVHGFYGYRPGDSLPTDNDILDGRRPSNSPAVRNVMAPGVKFQYSGGGTMITKKLVTDLTGMAYDKYMDEFVLKPLGMTHSSFTQPPPASVRKQLAAAYNTTAPVPGKFNIYPEQSPDGLWTTPEDLGHFIIEVQNSFAGRSNKVLSKEMTTTMLTPILEKAPTALGVFVENRGGQRYFRHAGSNIGFKCEYVASVENGNGLVIMTNCDAYNIIPEIINSVATVYQWKDFYKPVIKKVVHPDTSKLKDYVGEYKIANTTLRFKLEGAHLYINQDNSPYSRIYFESDDTFFINLAPGVTVRFVRDGQAKVTHLLIREGEDEKRAERK
jgi:CubicO group peptidase (beta-lactamase class C family)